MLSDSQASPMPRVGDPADRAVARTVWWTSAPQPPPNTPLRADIDVDVAIVGAGFIGLATGWRLASQGLSVAILEAGEPGEGASGLNAGFVVPNFAKADPEAVLSRLGQEAGAKLLRAVGASADAVFATIRDHAMMCEAEQVGWLHVAHEPDAAAMLRARVAAWRQLGSKMRFLEPDEARSLTGARHCHGALLDPSGGMLNPLAYARELARRAISSGVAIFGRTDVRRIEREGDRWRLEAGQGRVLARKVALCTNAFSTGAAAALGGGVVPLRVYQIATEPLDSEAARLVSPQRIPMADTRANLFTARLTRDNRLISGAMSVFPVGAEERMARAIARRLAAEYRLATPRVDFVWRGEAAMTPDFLPRIVQIADGVLGAIGCNGRGVALTHVVAEALARSISEPAAPLLVPIVRGGALPLRALAPAAASLAVLQVRLKDAVAGMWRGR